MSETTTETPQATPDAPAEQPDGKREAADQPLGEPGLKALQAERERADRLEKEINSLRPLKDQWSALQQVFGAKVEGDKPEDIVRNLQQQVEQMRHESRVNEVARTFGITDPTDLELMQQWGERLRGQKLPTPPTPEPDPGQGARQSTVSAEDVEYQQFYPSTRK
jgi:hypothetical protein